jgi:hypothetical protein
VRMVVVVTTPAAERQPQSDRPRQKRMDAHVSSRRAPGRLRPDDRGRGRCATIIGRAPTARGQLVGRRFSATSVA